MATADSPLRSMTTVSRLQDNSNMRQLLLFAIASIIAADLSYFHEFDVENRLSGEAFFLAEPVSSASE
jgi:hypothetical protein